MKFRDIISKFKGESSGRIRQRVSKARARQMRRFKGKRIYSNAQMGSKEVKKYCQVDEEGRGLLEMAVERFGFSARAYDRVLKVSRTIADLEGASGISPVHISEAIQYRLMDKLF